jgi:hypothetical protein
MRALAGIFGLMFGLIVGLLTAATANAASIVVSPGSVPVGGTVTVSGDVLGPNGQPGCQVPGTVILLSGAFAGQGSFMNQDVETTAGIDGKFSVQAHILSGVAPGTYTITGRCGGGNLGVQTALVVTAAGLPSTGSAGVLDARSARRPAGFPVAALLVMLSSMAVLTAGWLVWHEAGMLRHPGTPADVAGGDSARPGEGR